jgi:hypothetical protein
MFRGRTCLHLGVEWGEIVEIGRLDNGAPRSPLEVHSRERSTQGTTNNGENKQTYKEGEVNRERGREKTSEKERQDNVKMA